MKWVCEYCGSTNVDDQGACFICGTPRSEESIRKEQELLREEKRRARDALRQKLFDKIGDYTNKTAYITYIAGLVAAFGCIVVLLILHMVNGTLGMVGENLSAILHHPIEQVGQTLGGTLPDVFANFGNTFSEAAVSCGNIFTQFISVFTSRIPVGLEGIFIQIGENLSTLGETLGGLFTTAATSVSELIQGASHLIEEVTAYFR